MSDDPLGPTRPRRKDPRKFDPEVDPFPESDDIPGILEWKLDVIMVLLAKLERGLNIVINIFNLIIIPGLGAIIAILLAILGVLTAIQALVAFLTFLVLFIVIRVVVPFLRQQARNP